MQLSAINSVNFQGSKPALKKVRVNESSTSYESHVEKAQQKAKQDVHLSTVVAGVGIMAASIVKGKNIIALATKAVATIGESIAKGALKAGFGVVNAIKTKKGEAISPEKALNTVSDFAKKLRNENPTECTKIVNGARDFVGKIFGEDKGEIVANFLTKNGMNNTMGLAQGVAAGVVGAKIADGATDEIESAIDNKNISKAQRAEDAMNAFESIETIFEALAQ